MTARLVTLLLQVIWGVVRRKINGQWVMGGNWSLGHMWKASRVGLDWMFCFAFDPVTQWAEGQSSTHCNQLWVESRPFSVVRCTVGTAILSHREERYAFQVLSCPFCHVMRQVCLICLTRKKQTPIIDKHGGREGRATVQIKTRATKPAASSWWITLQPGHRVWGVKKMGAF